MLTTAKDGTYLYKSVHVGNPYMDRPYGAVIYIIMSSTVTIW